MIILGLIFGIILIIYLYRLWFTPYVDPETAEEKTVKDIKGLFVIIIFLLILDWFIKFLGI